MTAKKYLMQLRKIKTILDELETEIDVIRSSLTNISNPPKEVDVISSIPLDAFGDKIVKLTMMQDRYNRKWDEMIDLRAEIVGYIQSLQNPIQMQILYKHYVEFKPWVKVFAEIRSDWPEYTYSDRQFFRIHGIALMEISKLVSECQY